MSHPFSFYLYGFLMYGLGYGARMLAVWLSRRSDEKRRWGPSDDR